MSAKWRPVLLSEVADEVTVGFVGSMMSEYIHEGVPFLRSKNIEKFKINRDDLKFVSVDFHKKIIKSKLTPGDVVIVRTGKPGTCAVIPDWLTLANCSDLVIVRCGSDINNLFLAYYVNEVAAGHVSAHLVGAVQQHFNVSSAKKIEILLPPLQEQIRIADVLRSLDNKIELNRQFNQTLEAIAKNLFKSWFVDFDPVIDNALAAGNAIPEPFFARAELRRAYLTAFSDSSQPHRNTLNPELRALFPSSFVETEELGWIPEGWGIDTFADLTKQIRLNVNAEHIDSEEIYVGLEHIDKKHIFLNQCGVGSDVSSNKSRFEKGDLLFGKLRPYFHKVVVAPDKGISSTDILVFRAKKTYYHSYMLMVAFSDKFVEYAHAGSTGTRMPRASAKDLLSFAVALPNQNLLTVFESQLVNYWESGIARVNENTVLKDIRDTLLPKLLSGQLRIPDASVLVAEALA